MRMDGITEYGANDSDDDGGYLGCRAIDSSGDEFNGHENDSDNEVDIDLMSLEGGNQKGTKATGTMLADSIFDEEDEDAYDVKETDDKIDARTVDSAEWDANVVLARNWRSFRVRDPQAAEKVLLQINATKDKDSNVTSDPKALLKELSCTEFGRKVLTDQISRSREAMIHFGSSSSSLTSPPSGSAVYHAMIASALTMLGDYRQALPHWECAVSGDPRQKYPLWQLRYEQVGRKVASLDACAGLRADENSISTSSPSHSTSPPIPRIAAEKLSYAEFVERFASKGKPVIITGLLQKCLKEQRSQSFEQTQKEAKSKCAGGTQDEWFWDLDHLRARIGHRYVKLKRYTKNSPNWARLDEEPFTTTIATFIESIQNRKNCNSPISEVERTGFQSKYCHDWSIPLHCPELLQPGFRIPKYFAADYLQQTPQGTLYKDTWPSLFIGPKGTFSELHVDAFFSNFWMGLMQGRKRWVFFKREDIGLLEPEWTSPTTLDPTFKITPRNPDHMKRIMQRCKPMITVLNQGEVLYVPAGCPHFVENLDDTVAISANYVDASNREGSVKELKAQGLTSQQSKELAQLLGNSNFIREADLRVAKIIHDCESKESPVADGFTIPWETFKRKHAPNGGRESEDSVKSKIPSTGILKHVGRDTKIHTSKRVRFSVEKDDTTSRFEDSSQRESSVHFENPPPGFPTDTVECRDPKKDSEATNIPPGGQSLEEFLRRKREASAATRPSTTKRQRLDQHIKLPSYAHSTSGLQENQDCKITHEGNSSEEDEIDDRVVLQLGQTTLKIGKRTRKKGLSSLEVPKAKFADFRDDSRSIHGTKSFVTGRMYNRNYGHYNGGNDEYQCDDVIGIGYPKFLRKLGYPKRMRKQV